MNAMRRVPALLALVAMAACARGGAAVPEPRDGGSAIARDPALTVGTLPNGLRYYIRANDMPAGRAELRLVVNAGAMLEDDDQRGMAHFLEHMAFNGTTHFPAQSLIDFVEESGMRFGADLNAYTSYDETVYLLTVPTDDPRFLERGLTVLQDWASGGILIDSAEVVAERGVVLGEWRSSLSDTTSQKIQRHQREVLFGPDSRHLERLPIGLPSLLRSATRGPIERFYRDWYRPDLMAVVVVGDVDADAIEREIAARFGAIAASPASRTRPAPELARSGETVVDVQRGRLTPSVQVLWPVLPLPAEPRELLERQLAERILLRTLEARFREMRELESRPFVVVNLQRGTIARSLELVGFQLIAWPDSLERGLATVLAEIERVAQRGIPAETIEREKAALLGQLEHEAARAAARSSKRIADEYTRHYLTGAGALMTPAQELVLARELLPALTPARLAEAARFWRSDAGRKVLVQLPELTHMRPPTRGSVLAIFDSVAALTLPALDVGAVAEGARLDTPPAPGRIVGETRHEASGIAEWSLSNGARVLFKPSENDPGELLLRAWSPGGFSRVPDSLFFSSGRMVARMMTETSGLGSRERGDLVGRLATTGVRELDVEIGFGDESIALGGSPRDVELLFQRLHLLFTAPGLDSATLAAWKNYAKYEGRSFSIFDQLAQTFARGNPRLVPVSTRMAELAKLDEAMALYRDRFGNAGDFTFTIVGAATAEQVKPLVERYLASLPATAKRETPKDPQVKPFLMRVVETSRLYDVPKASTVLVFDGLISAEPADYLAERQRLATLTEVLSRRLRTRLREELGATYGVAVMDRTYPLPKEHYQVLISFDAEPDRMRSLKRELAAILDVIRDDGATEVELERVRTAQRRQLETLLQENDYWMERIGLFDRLGIPLDRIVSPVGPTPVTAAGLRDAARRYLPDDVYIQLTTMPSDTTTAATEDSASGARASRVVSKSSRGAR